MATLADAFTRDICEHPEDTAARLIFADWLEENGEEERAEFIRVQCAIAADLRVNHGPEALVRGCTCSLCGFRRREQQLLRCHAGLWTSRPLSEGWTVATRTGDRVDSTFVFSRGFVETVHCPCHAWLRHGPDIVLRQPVTAAYFTDWPRPRRRPLMTDGGVVDSETVDFAGHVLRAVATMGRSADEMVAIWWARGNKLIQAITLATRRKHFPDRQSAEGVVARACVEWARQESNLPPLPREPRPGDVVRGKDGRPMGIVM